MSSWTEGHPTEELHWDANTIHAGKVVLYLKSYHLSYNDKNLCVEFIVISNSILVFFPLQRPGP